MTVKFDKNISTNSFIPYTEKAQLSNLPDELIKIILNYSPSQLNPLVCTKFYNIVVESIKNFPNNDNKLVYQVFHKSILKHLIGESVDCLKTHAFLLNATEKLHPFAKGLPGNENEETKSLLSQPENLEINRIVNFWKSCHGDLSFMSFNDIVLLDYILNGHYSFALKVFEIHPDYPLNISPWKLNGEVCKNKAYTEVRRKIIACIGTYLIENDKIHEFLAILGREYDKIIESNFEWENLLDESLKKDILKKLNPNGTHSDEEITKIFTELIEKSEEKNFSDLLTGLALVYPGTEFELNM